MEVLFFEYEECGWVVEVWGSVKDGFSGGDTLDGEAERVGVIDVERKVGVGEVAVELVVVWLGKEFWRWSWAGNDVIRTT